MVEITSEEQNKVKRIKRTEDSLRDLWDNIKHNIWIIEVPEEEEQKKKKKEYKKIFEEIIVENLKYWKGKIYNQDYSIQQGFHSNLMEKSKGLQINKN